MSESFPVGFGRYELVDRLAVGGMAELYRATMAGAHDFHKRVVIKKILPHLAADEEFVAMFIDEAKITAQLLHPKIVQVFELGAINSQLFIAMELVEGLDVLHVLREYARKRSRLPEHVAVHIAHEVLDALDYAHNARDDRGRPLGVVHRDISPGNILLSRRGNVKLTDFGIARAAANRERTESGTLKGKYGYMSPEQVVNADVDARSDVFAVGVVLAEMLMGRRLFVAPSDLDVLLMVRDVRLDRLDRYGAHIPAELRTILETALERDIDTRYQAARDFRDALGDYLFAARRRVHANDVAKVIEQVIAADEEAARLAAEAEAALHSVDFDDVSTISGPDTLRRKLAASEAAAIGRAQFEASMSGVPLPVEEAEDATNQIVRAARNARLAVPEPLAPAPEPETTTPEIHPPEFPVERDDEVGEFARTPAIRLLYQLAAERATGLLEVEVSGIKKQIYLVDGAPQVVVSNVAAERLGEFLVNQGKLAPGELSMALSVLGHFGGKLADTLIGLGLMDPLAALKALRDQVRTKVVDVCTWEKGSYSWHAGREAPPSQKLHLDGFEIVAAGALALEQDFIEGWVQWEAGRTPQRVEQPVPLDAFGLGTRAHYVHHLLDGKRTLAELHAEFHDKDNWLDALRILYLMVQTGYAELEGSDDLALVDDAEVDTELT